MIFFCVSFQGSIDRYIDPNSPSTHPFFFSQEAPIENERFELDGWILLPIFLAFLVSFFCWAFRKFQKLYIYVDNIVFFIEPKRVFHPN